MEITAKNVIDTLIARGIDPDVSIRATLDDLSISAWMAEGGWLFRIHAEDIDDIYVNEDICKYVQDVLQKSLSILSNLREGWTWDYHAEVSAKVAYETLYIHWATVDCILMAHAGWEYGYISAYRLNDGSFVARIYCALRDVEYHLISGVEEDNIDEKLLSLVDYKDLGPHEYVLHMCNWHGPEYCRGYINDKYGDSYPVRIIVCKRTGCHYLLREDGSPVVFSRPKAAEAWADEYIQAHRSIYNGEQDLPQIIFVPENL